MKAEYTIKIGDVYYKAGQEIPDSKAVSAEKAEPPVSPVVEDEPKEEVKEKPSKRQYTRKK